MNTHVHSPESFEAAYQDSIKDPEAFWSEVASGLTWKKKWDKVLEWDFTKPEVKWFIGGKLNKIGRAHV